MPENKTIIIHSKVSVGYVGSNTTSLVLQMGGYDVVTIPTVLYSNHLGHATVGGGIVPDALFSDILAGVLKLGVVKEVSSVITGFIGSSSQIRMVAAFIRKVKQFNPDVLYLCDPVMGDTDKGLYVEADVPESIIEYLLPLADLLTPNQFEAERIVGKPIHTLEDSFKSVSPLNVAKQKWVVTGCNFDGWKSDYMYNCVVDGDGVLVKSDKIDLHPPGTGELFTAHLYLSLQQGRRFKDAVILSGKILSAVLKEMWNESRTEFELKDILYSLKCRLSER